MPDILHYDTKIKLHFRLIVYERCGNGLLMTVSNIGVNNNDMGISKSQTKNKNKNIPILPEAFLTFASKSFSAPPMHPINPNVSQKKRQEPETCTNLKSPPYGKGLILNVLLNTI